MTTVSSKDSAFIACIKLMAQMEVITPRESLRACVLLRGIEWAENEDQCQFELTERREHETE